MLKSMTGFGRGEGETSLGRVSIESRSVNHRYCDISIKLPRRLAVFESRIRDIVRSEVSRGKIDIALRLDATGEGKVQLKADLHLAQQYYQALATIREQLRLRDKITLGMLAGAKDLIAGKEEMDDVEPYWHEMEPILRQALRGMDDMKRSEGEVIAKDIRVRLKKITQEVDVIRQQFPSRLRAYQERLRERLLGVLSGLEVDPSRFQQEIAILAERTDITEEMVRAGSHLGQLADLMEKGESVGRKLDFLLQEINREINTTSSKANDAEISQRTVEIKSELEKVREQVQNIE
jgi:uncharacterized protein (TIGR00255 family)